MIPKPKKRKRNRMLTLAGLRGLLKKLEKLPGTTMIAPVWKSADQVPNDDEPGVEIFGFRKHKYPDGEVILGVEVGLFYLNSDDDPCEEEDDDA